MKYNSYILPVALSLAAFLCPAAQAAEPNPTTEQDIVTSDLDQPRTIEPADIDSLIDNLAGGLPKTIQTRVFSAGQVLDGYSESALTMERTAGVFDPRSRALVVHGAMNGTPVLEDFQFLVDEGTFYVLHNIHLNGSVDDLATGRGTPIKLKASASVTASATSSTQTVSSNAVLAPTNPTITAVHGYTNVASVGVNDGVVQMSCGKNYNGGRAVNNQATTFYWNLYGINLGTSGTIQLAGITVPASAIATWTPTYIQFYPVVPWNWGAVSTTLSITTSAGRNVKYGVGVVPAIQTRLLGQCTWFDAYTRISIGKQPSPTAYPQGTGWSSISSAYAPQLWDQLVWTWTDSSGSHQHTAIITGLSGPTTTGTTKTWTVTIGEANAACANAVTSRTSTYQVQNGVIVKSIQTSAVALAPAWYYR